MIHITRQRRSTRSQSVGLWHLFSSAFAHANTDIQRNATHLKAVPAACPILVLCHYFRTKTSKFDLYALNDRCAESPSPSCYLVKCSVRETILNLTDGPVDAAVCYTCQHFCQMPNSFTDVTRSSHIPAEIGVIWVARVLSHGCGRFGDDRASIRAVLSRQGRGLRMDVGGAWHPPQHPILHSHLYLHLFSVQYTYSV